MLDDKKNELEKLVKLFHDNIKQYKSNKYDEANTRVDFIDKFFELLDWDVRNTQGYSEQYREVVREDKVSIQGKQKAPDYSFRIGGVRKFFVEAKKPSIDIKHDIEPAFQIRRYGYTAKLPLSILTDFEEYSIYDTRIKPVKTDKASMGRVFYCTYDDLLNKSHIDGYENNFDFLYQTFSKPAILKGSFDKYIEENKNKKGTSEVDKEFLKLIEEWRNELAKNIALRNLNLDVYNLNSAVQKIIDRLIFLRIAEDRQMEDYGKLKEISESKDIYKSLIKLFDYAEDKYNSGLFTVLDWLNALVIDDKILTKIIKELYYPDCPYEFSVMPIEILGHVYEQFLGKTIRLTSSHQAKIEEKPEVRKAGGVYYTPKYIVDYIVENTVGEKLKRSNPEKVAGGNEGFQPLAILDPACGSGSFLVGAYTYLLNWHLTYYTNSATSIKKALKDENIYQISENTYQLTISEKKKILLNNIYGVDIDSQAVEVTKLSLLLKLLEDENVQFRDDLFNALHLKLLPDLSSNIKCGNSLIGSDFYKDKNMSLFDKLEMRKVNVFDWDKEFPGIFKNGGFDVVIGNPPYVLSRELMTNDEKSYYYNNYEKLIDKPNLYFLFFEKSLKLLKENGLISFIIPNSWLTIDSGIKLREYILKDFNIIKLNDILFEVFENAKVETTIFVIIKSKINLNTNCRKIIYNQDFNKNYYEFDQNNWLEFSDNSKIYLIENIDLEKIIRKIENNSKTIGDIFDVRAGLQAYEKGKGKPKQSANDVKNRIYDYDYKYDDTTYPYLDGKNCERYFFIFNNKYLRYGEWLSQTRTIDIFSRKRILVREITGKLPYSIKSNYFHELYLNNKSILNILDYDDNDDNLKILLAQLNSKLLSIYYKSRAVKSSRKLFPKIVVKDLRRFPCIIDINNKKTIISQINQMLESQKLFHEAKTNDDKKIYQQKIDILDKQIDDLVYELYGLTDEEIKVVEESL